MEGQPTTLNFNLLNSKSYYEQCKLQGNGKSFVTGYHQGPLKAGDRFIISKLVHVIDDVTQRDSKGVFTDESLRINAHFEANCTIEQTT